MAPVAPGSADETGKYLEAWDQPGEGRGEFRWPAGLAVMRDGRVVILDTGYPGYHLFNADGEYERSVRLLQ